MLNVHMEGLSSEQVILMADALALKGFVSGATNLYATALAAERDLLLRYRLRLRIGLLPLPTGQGVCIKS